MAPTSGDRAAHFPAIERKHGRPVAYYLDELADLGDAKYQEQIDLLRERPADDGEGDRHVCSWGSGRHG